PETRQGDRRGASQRAGEGEKGPQREAALAADALHVERRRHCGDRSAEHPARDRQRGEAGVRRERQARQAIDCNQGRVVREQQRLARGEEADVAPLFAALIALLIALSTVWIYSISHAP